MKRLNLLLLLICVTAYSQKVEIKGVIKDEFGDAISNILVTVLSKDKTTLTYEYSNNEGQFSFSLDRTDEVLFLKASSLFYEEKEIKIDILKTKDIVFVLQPKTTQLDEVVLTAAKIRNDTINLGLQKYNVTKTESIEKALKKIPGISIDKDGRIKFWNTEIEKILIDGDDLASEQYTFISRNLRAEVLDDIQVLKNFEENTVFKKIRNSDKIALNLKIKEEFKNIWFGNISSGYGNGGNSESEYKGDTNIGLLKKKTKFLNALNYSTLGKKSIPIFFGDNNYEVSNNPIYNIRTISLPLPNEVTNFNNAFGNTFLANKKFKNTTLRSTIFIGVDTQQQEIVRSTEFFIQGDSLNETNDIDDRKLLLFGELELKNDALENNFFLNKFKYKFGSDRSSSLSSFNTNTTTDFNEREEVSFYNFFQHTYSFKKGIVLNNELNFGISNLEENTSVNSQDLNSFFQNTTAVNQNVDKQLRYFGVKTDATYFLTRKLKSNFQLNYKNSTESFDINLIPRGTLEQNDVSFTRNEFILETSLIYKFSKKFRLEGGLSSNFFKLNNDNQTLINYNTAIQLRYWGTIDLSYSRKQTITSNQNFLQNFYLINNNSFQRGGLFFNPLDYEQVKFVLNNKNQTSTYNNEFSFTYKNSKSALLQDFSLVDNINFNNTTLINRTGEDYSFREQLILLINTLGLKIETTHSFSSIPLNNQNLDLTKIYNGLYSVELTSYFSSSLNFNLKFQYNNNVQRFDLSRSAFDSKSVILDFDWDIGKEVAFNLNGGIYELDNNYYNIFNSSLNYIPSNSNFSYSIRVNNILNENEFLFQQRSSFFNSVTAIPLVPFYAFGSIKYIF